MIQAPNAQYIPQQIMPQQAYMPQQGAVSNVQYNTTPGFIYNYPTASSYYPNSYCTERSQYNGVNIEIINPQGQGGMPGAMPATYAPVYTPMALPPAQVPLQLPPAQVPLQLPPAQVPVQETPIQIPATPVQIPQPEIQPATPVVVTPNVPQAEVPQAATPVIEAPEQIDPSKTPGAFAARLRTEDLDAQKEAIWDIAKAFKDSVKLTTSPSEIKPEELEEAKMNKKIAGNLLDTQISDALFDIVDKDVSSLEQATPEVIALREKPENELTAAEKEKAQTRSPYEKAINNKQYALYTLAYMQECLNTELESRGSKALELKDLPQIDKIVDTVKSNPEPTLRKSAVRALAHIARPEYKDDLKTLFEIAKTDEDEEVRDAAEKALNVVNNIK